MSSEAEKTILGIIQNAMGENGWEAAGKPFGAKLEETKTEMVTKPSTETENAKSLVPFKTETFLDQMFLDRENKIIGGLPFGSNSVLSGIPNTGKSLLIAEIALRVANSGKKVIFVTSEEIWRVETGRFDLENRFRERAKVLSLNWESITNNLYVLDAVKFADLREWHTFVSVLRGLVEKEKIELLLIDSLTLLEDSRGQLKYRLLELMKYGQIHGLTSIIISQRATDDTDGFSLSGGLGLSHIADIVFILDQKKVSSWDAVMKLDMDVKQSELVNFFRILKCRLSKYRANYFQYEITSDGFVKLKPKDETATTPQ